MFTPSVVNPILIAIFIIFYHTNTKATFGSHKVLKKEKNVKENGFFIFGFVTENTKENKI